jgi:LysM repeat protein
VSAQRAGFFFLILLLLLSSCGDQSTISEDATNPAPGGAAITPYQTATIFETIAPTATDAPTPTPPPLPTPTPFLHTVTEGETMIGIAAYYGITLDELTLANPEANPNFLTIGTQLVIPLPEEGEQADASSTTDPEILPVQTGELICTPNQLGGLQCFLPMTNNLEQPLENLAALIRLFDASGEEVLSLPGYSLVNVLMPGEQIPIAVYFPPPLPEWDTVQAQLTSAAAANEVEARYLNTEIMNLNTDPLSDDRLGYQISGTLTLSPLPDETLPDYAWVVAVAYDASDQPVGVRRWEAGPDQLAGSIDFTFQVYSLSGPIERVELLSEGRAP